MNDPLLKKIKLKSPEEIIARARDIISRHRRRFLSRNLNPCPGNCAMAEMMGRKITGCGGCGTIDPNKCIHPEKFQPAYSKEELAKQFAEELRDPGTLLRDYRDVVVFFWVLGAFDEEKQVDEEIVSKVEKKHVETRSTAENSSRDGSTEVSPHDVQGGERPADTRSPVLPRDSDDSEPNYNRAESNYSSTDARLGGTGKLQSRAKGAKQP
jgi:hypothetical protein